jgi:DNA-binding NtrC family response regulator
MVPPLPSNRAGALTLVPLSPRVASSPVRAEEGLKAIGRRAALEAECAVLRAVLQEVRWNRRQAARRLKVSYKTLRSRIRQCGLDKD